MQQLTTITMMKYPKYWSSYFQAASAIVVCTVITLFLGSHVTYTNVILIYLCGIVFSAQLGRGPAVLSAIFASINLLLGANSALLITSTLQFILTCGLILSVALIVSNLTVQIKQQAWTAQEHERLTARLYALSESFADSIGTQAVIAVATNYINDFLKTQSMIFLSDCTNDTKTLTPQLYNQHITPLNTQELGIVQWVFEQGQEAGYNTQTLPGTHGLYLPLKTSTRVMGVVGIYLLPTDTLTAEQKQILTVLTNQIAIAIERIQFAEATEQAKLEMIREQLRNTLLSSISHDLRTPLTSVTGAVSGLLEKDIDLSAEDRHELAQIAYEESRRLNRLIGNLLEMTRIQTGGIHVNKEWQAIEDVVMSAVARFARHSDHPISLNIPPDLPFIRYDEILVQQVLIHLLENAIEYTPSGSSITISIHDKETDFLIAVTDNGLGLPFGEENKIFEKFYRAQSAPSGGAGLGLAICKAIVEACGGRIWAKTRTEGGAGFYFTIPLDEQPQEFNFDE